MGRDVAEAFPESSEVFRDADAALGIDLARTCFEGSEEELARTETTQPAILTASIAVWRALESRGVRPAAAAGHSLGEYSAHVAAGTLRFADAVRAVRLRGRFMQEAVPLGVGSMAAILGLDPDRVADLCASACVDGDVVVPANLNGAGQVVVAGHVGAVDRVVSLASAAGAKRAVTLQVSAPFHSPLMEPASRRLAEVLAGVPFADPRFPVWTNVDARAVERGGDAREALVRQVVSPVRWADSMAAMADQGIGTFVEVGPGRVLSGLVRRIRRDLRVYSVSTPDEVEAAARELKEQ